MNYEKESTRTLLHLLIGEKATTREYRGALAPLFEDERERDQRDLAPLLVARELLQRWLAEGLEKRNSFASPVEVKKYLIVAFAGQPYESFVTLYLDAQHRLILAEESFRGTLTHTSVYPREIVRRALALNAGAVLFAHNHPSGLAEPSRADEALTQSLKQTLALVDVRVLDHFVVGGNCVVSFAERGLL
jgi:DNA repair protein RadC